MDKNADNFLNFDDKFLDQCFDLEINVTPFIKKAFNAANKVAVRFMKKRNLMHRLKKLEEPVKVNDFLIQTHNVCYEFSNSAKIKFIFRVHCFNLTDSLISHEMYKKISDKSALTKLSYVEELLTYENIDITITKKETNDLFANATDDNYNVLEHRYEKNGIKYYVYYIDIFPEMNKSNHKSLLFIMPKSIIRDFCSKHIFRHCIYSNIKQHEDKIFTRLYASMEMEYLTKISNLLYNMFFKQLRNYYKENYPFFYNFLVRNNMLSLKLKFNRTNVAFCNATTNNIIDQKTLFINQYYYLSLLTYWMLAKKGKIDNFYGYQIKDEKDLIRIFENNKIARILFIIDVTTHKFAQPTIFTDCNENASLRTLIENVNEKTVASWNGTSKNFIQYKNLLKNINEKYAFLINDAMECISEGNITIIEMHNKDSNNYNMFYVQKDYMKHVLTLYSGIATNKDYVTFITILRIVSAAERIYKHMFGYDEYTDFLDIFMKNIMHSIKSGKYKTINNSFYKETFMKKHVDSKEKIYNLFGEYLGFLHYVIASMNYFTVDKKTFMKYFSNMKRIAQAREIYHRYVNEETKIVMENLNENENHLIQMKVIETKTVGEYTIEQLTHAFDFIRDGREMSHCIATYISKAAKKQYIRYFRVRNKHGNLLANAEVEFKNGSQTILQLKGPKNSEPSDELKKAFFVFLNTLSKKEREDAEKKFNHSTNDDYSFMKKYDGYRFNDLISKRALSRMGFVEKTDIDDKNEENDGCIINDYEDAIELFY